jgi:hypothetical protein
MKRFTRKLTKSQSGGNMIGKEGAHGVAFNLDCGSPGKSLCSLLKPLKITKIRFFCNDGPNRHITDPKLILEFVEFLGTEKHRIAKIFKPKHTLSKTSLYSDFMEEIAANKTVLGVYKDHATKFTTLNPVTGFKNLDIIGLIVNFKDDKTEPLHVIMGSKCQGLTTIHLDKFIIDMLCSILILQSADYEHNDIKLDNIVKCQDRYKLIDWGQATQIGKNPIKMGSLFTTSPIRWYISGHLAYISSEILAFKAHQNDPEYAKWSPFIKTNERINSEFYTIVKATPNRSTLRKLYANSFDLFMLGLTILYAVYKYKLNYIIYKPIIDHLTSLKRPETPLLETLVFCKTQISINSANAESKPLLESIETMFELITQLN